MDNETSEPTSSHDLDGNLRSDLQSVRAEFADLAAEFRDVFRIERKASARELRTLGRNVANPATRTDTLKGIVRALVRVNAGYAAILAVALPLGGAPAGWVHFFVGVGLAMVVAEMAWAGNWFSSPRPAKSATAADPGKAGIPS
jgi:hypothetical protein